MSMLKIVLTAVDIGLTNAWQQASGLGTGVGRVRPDICATQVRAAIDDVLLKTNDFPETWYDAQMRHQLLYRQRVTDLQREL